MVQRAHSPSVRPHASIYLSLQCQAQRVRHTGGHRGGARNVPAALTRRDHNQLHRRAEERLRDQPRLRWLQQRQGVSPLRPGPGLPSELGLREHVLLEQEVRGEARVQVRGSYARRHYATAIAIAIEQNR